jgi:hypothetical protein
MRIIHRLLLVAITISRLTITAPVHAQTIPDLAWRPHRWDAAHGVLFLGKNVMLRRTGRLLRSYRENGSQRGADIDLFKDFPDLQEASVDDFAAGPAGTTLIVAELIYSARLVKHSLLTYDSAGALRAVVDIAPYSAEAITTDEQGNIFVLGEREDAREGDPPYPLLIKYDPSGNILGRAIYSNVFKDGSDAIQFFGFLGPGEGMVSASVMLQGGNLYVYAPDQNEVLICAVDGKIVRRAKLDDVLSNVARADKVHRAAIADVAFLDENHVVLYLTEYVKPDDPQVVDIANMHTAAYWVDLTSKKFKLILEGEPGLNPGFLGISGNQLLTLARGQRGFEIQSHALP